MKQRVGYFDFLRGVAILLVIAIHTYTVDSFDTPIGFVRIVLRQFCNVAVPLFLAISGFFMAKKHILQWQDILPFFRRQLTKIYFPTLIWSIPLLLQFYGQCHDLIKSMIYYVFCGLGVYYFVALILQCYVVTPFIGRLPARSVLLYSAIISCVSIFCVTYFVSIKGIHVPLFVYAGPLFVWLVFYVLGFSLYHIERSYDVRIPLLVILLGFMLEVIESYYLIPLNGVGFGIKLSAFLYSFGVIQLLFSDRIISLCDNKCIFYRLLHFVGELSFGIYLIHYQWIILLRKFFWPNLWSVRWCMTLLFTICSLVLLKKILPEKINRYLGLWNV